MNNDERDLHSRLIGQLCAILMMHTMKKKNAKKTLFYDGIHYSIKMARSSYKNLVDKLSIIADFKVQDLEPLAESAIAEAWSIVDSLHRLRKLLEGTPELKQKSPQLQLFYRKTECLKDLRNSIQHLDGSIEEYVCHQIPAWGRLSWVYPVSEQRYKACMIAPGDFQPDWKLMPSHIGEKMRPPVDLICITTNKTVCITYMIDALGQLLPWLNIQLNGYFNRKHQLMIMLGGISTNYNIYR